MLKPILIALLVGSLWLVTVRAAWIAISNPEGAQDWLDENFPTGLAWNRIFISEPVAELRWIRFQGSVLMALMLLLGFDLVQKLLSTFRL